MIRVINVNDLSMLKKEEALVAPYRIHMFSFEVHNGKPVSLVVSTDMHYFLVIKGLDDLGVNELKAFKHYLKSILVAKIPSGPYNTLPDVKYALDTFGVEVQTI